MTCCAPACGRPSYCKGLCTKHYQRLQNHGTLEDPLVRRFWSKVDKSGEHWIWGGTRNAGGYGRYHQHLAHRLAYELTYGPIPLGQPLDHLCRVTSCVRPEHLEPVTYQENVARGYGPNINAARQRAITHCPRGHEYTQANTRVNTAGARNCRKCSWLRRHDPAAYHATKYGRPTQDQPRRAGAT